MTGLIASMPKVFEIATSVTEAGSRRASCAASAISRRTAARGSAAVASGGVARSFKFNSSFEQAHFEGSADRNRRGGAISQFLVRNQFVRVDVIAGQQR